MLTVDYKTVLEQAVANERWAVLRELRRTVATIKTTKPGSNYRNDDRTADQFKNDLLTKLDEMEREQQ